VLDQRPHGRADRDEDMQRRHEIKTEKGTTLPLMELKGKSYLQVAYRLVWFREEHPDWTIETEALEIADDHAIFKATVRDQNGRLIATGTKSETRTGFPDFLEKAETGAIGRALALCGYGTQFAPELDEGERIVDTPVMPTSVDETPAPRGARAVRQFAVSQKATPKQLKFVAALAIHKLGADPDKREDILEIGRASCRERV